MGSCFHCEKLSAVFDLTQIKDLIVRVITAQELYSESAVNLLLGTMATESDFGTYLSQVGGGPARGIFQTELATEKDIWKNYLYLGRLARRAVIYHVTGVRSYNNGGALEWNIAYQICMARLLYRRVQEPFPDASDIEGLGVYYKKYYNTPEGKGSAEKFVEAYNKYVGVKNVR